MTAPPAAGPLITGAVERSAAWLRALPDAGSAAAPGGPRDAVTARCEAAALCEAAAALCDAALAGPPPRANAPGERRPAFAGWTRLEDLLRDDTAVMRALAGEIARVTAFGAAPGVREPWDIALPVLLSLAVRRGDLPTLAALIRASFFLHGHPAPLAVRAARFLAAQERPGGGYGPPVLTAGCAWALAEAAAPGVTAANPALRRTLCSAPATYGGKE